MKEEELIRFNEWWNQFQYRVAFENRSAAYGIAKAAWGASRALSILDIDSKKESRVKELEDAIRNIPWHEYGDALREGCDANGAWDCFSEAMEKHFEKVIVSNT